MISHLFFPLLVLVLSPTTNAAEQLQKALTPTKTQEPNPTITASVKSIFSTFSSEGSSTFDPKSVTGCCGSTCALGLCNGIYPFDTTLPPDAAHTATASAPATTEDCCTAGCPDGFCRGFERWRHRWPIGCVGRDCSVPTGQRWSHWQPGGRSGGPPGRAQPSDCEGRTCTPGIGNNDFALTTIYASADHAASQDVKPTSSPSSNAKAVEEDPTQQFHAGELAGKDQDTLPIIVENNDKEPVTLLADIDLALAENYISSGMLSALGIPSTSSALTPIAKEDQRLAALGTPAFQVTPDAKITLNLLAGPKGALKQFGDVEFNVFDLPPVSERGGVPWEPEVFLGVVFLREASALRLTDDFVGHAALEGLPVLVRNMTEADSAAGANKMAEEGRQKDEL